MILALDVALKNTGWAVLTNNGELRDLGIISNPVKHRKGGPSTAQYCVDCSVKIARELLEILTKWDVGMVVGELPTGGAKSALAMRGMALATGAVAASLAIMDIETHWTTPREGKIAACNDPHASKDDMIQAMQDKYRTQLERLNVNLLSAKKYEHVADALASYEAFLTRL